jgi:hypothetical protein
MSLENLSLEARDELASLAQTLAENPDTRKDFLRMTKKIKPGMPIPELDIEEHTNRAISASDARVQALESKLRERDAQSELEKRRNNLIANKNVRKEDIPEIEKLMLEKQIPSHDTAAEYFEYMRQAAKPTPSGFNPSAVRQFDLGKFWKNPREAAQQEAVKAFADLRKPQRPIGL